MANKRLALVACMTSAEGPWTLAKGNESGLSIKPLNGSETIWLDVLQDDGQQSSIAFHSAGLFEIPFSGFTKYRVRKVVIPSAEASPTTVEVTLNGTAKS